MFGSKLKFLSIIGSQIWPNRTSKGAKKTVVGFAPIETLKRGFIVDDFGRKSINEEYGSGKSFIPKFKW